MKTGYIYKIVCNNTNKVYYGSTTQPVCRRIATHKAKFKSYENGTHHYVSSFEIIGGGNYQYFTVEKLEFEDKFELTNKEKEYIKNNECINKIVPNRQYKEYYQDNKEKQINKSKEYREANKDKIKQWREQNKDKLKEYNQIHKDKLKEQNKEWREQNKDKIKQYKKEYYQDNKDKLKQLREQKANCPHCNKEMLKGNINRHIKNKH